MVRIKKTVLEHKENMMKTIKTLLCGVAVIGVLGFADLASAQDSALIARIQSIISSGNLEELNNITQSDADIAAALFQMALSSVESDPQTALQAMRIAQNYAESISGGKALVIRMHTDDGGNTLAGTTNDPLVIRVSPKQSANLVANMVRRIVMTTQNANISNEEKVEILTIANEIASMEAVASSDSTLINLTSNALAISVQNIEAAAGGANGVGTQSFGFNNELPPSNNPTPARQASSD